MTPSCRPRRRRTRLGLLLTLLSGLLLGCTTTSAPTSAQTIHAYAARVQAGDVTAARTLLRNPSIDWQESTTRMLAHAVTGYTLADQATSAVGDTATIVWQTARGRGPYCTFVRVRADSGELELVRASTFLCPAATAAP